MAKSSSVNKVAKAAASGGRPQARPGERNIFFPVAMVAVVLIGIVFIVLARSERIDNADNSAPRAGEDHWHSAYEINICGEVQPIMPNDSVDDRTGIHTHGDGLVHIHPFLASVQGRNATLGVFFEEGGFSISDDRLVVPSGTYDEADATCNGNPAEIVVLKWVNVSADDPVVFRDGLADIRLDNNDPRRGQLFSIALVEQDADLDFAALKPNRDFLENYIISELDELPLDEPDPIDGDTTPTTAADESTEGE